MTNVIPTISNKVAIQGSRDTGKKVVIKHVLNKTKAKLNALFRTNKVANNFSGCSRSA